MSQTYIENMERENRELKLSLYKMKTKINEIVSNHKYKLTKCENVACTHGDIKNGKFDPYKSKSKSKSKSKIKNNASLYILKFRCTGREFYMNLLDNRGIHLFEYDKQMHDMKNPLELEWLLPIKCLEEAEKEILKYILDKRGWTTRGLTCDVPMVRKIKIEFI